MPGFLLHLEVECRFAKESLVKYRDCMRQVARVYGVGPMTSFTKNNLMELKANLMARNLSINRQVSVLLILKRFLKHLARISISQCSLPMPSHPTTAEEGSRVSVRRGGPAVRRFDKAHERRRERLHARASLPDTRGGADGHRNAHLGSAVLDRGKSTSRQPRPRSSGRVARSGSSSSPNGRSRG